MLCIHRSIKHSLLPNNINDDTITKSITKTSLFKYTENFTPKSENFPIKIRIFHISAQNIDCGYALEPPRRGGSNAYPQSMFLSRNKKNNVYPCKPQFYYIRVGFKGVNIISRHVFVMPWSFHSQKAQPSFLTEKGRDGEQTMTGRKETVANTDIRRPRWLS